MLVNRLLDLHKRSRLHSWVCKLRIEAFLCSRQALDRDRLDLGLDRHLSLRWRNRGVSMDSLGQIPEFKDMIHDGQDISPEQFVSQLMKQPEIREELFLGVSLLC